MMRSRVAQAARKASAPSATATKLFVHVHPGSSRSALVLDSVVGDGDAGQLNVSARVTARAHDGEANDALRRLVAESLGVSRSRVSILRGEKSRDKIVAVDGMSHDDVVTVLSDT
ncbi:hypothetical protein EXIGLDRAFT_846593 [Exidia glandulosa HHB12029]|uniref:DUF167-domain-containing protein n=1 Tax=Exidia glandulosa HHB12029 TaxID=1314781 RepID=A0A165ATI6_EXIGL|nr:hypothetical protein EXIGLDRAFT_846593 [Exidia glandulosa HHB12029]